MAANADRELLGRAKRGAGPIDRARQGRRATWRKTGSVSFLPGGGGVNCAGDVPCPKGAQWERY